MVPAGFDLAHLARGKVFRGLGLGLRPLTWVTFLSSLSLFTTGRMGGPLALRVLWGNSSASNFSPTCDTERVKQISTLSSSFFSPDMGPPAGRQKLNRKPESSNLMGGLLWRLPRSGEGGSGKAPTGTGSAGSSLMTL